MKSLAPRTNTIRLATSVMLAMFCHNGLILAQAQGNTDTTPKQRVNPFMQMGRDSMALERLKEAKEAEQRKIAAQQKDGKKTQQATVNTPTNYFMGEDKYLKVRNDDRRYDTFQVYDINHMDKKHAVVGLLTNTLPRGTRYDDKGEKEKKVVISTGFLDKVDEKGVLIPGGKVAISSIRFNDKIFVIIGEKDYRYLDGKKVVGNQQMVKELLKGKPVTELTFYYELHNAGIIAEAMSYKQFSSLSLEQKFNLLSSGN